MPGNGHAIFAYPGPYTPAPAEIAKNDQGAAIAVCFLPRTSEMFPALRAAFAEMALGKPLSARAALANQLH